MQDTVIILVLKYLKRHASKVNKSVLYETYMTIIIYVYHVSHNCFCTVLIPKKSESLEKPNHAPYMNINDPLFYGTLRKKNHEEWARAQ